MATKVTSVEVGGSKRAVMVNGKEKLIDDGTLSHRERFELHGPSQTDTPRLLLDVLDEMQAQTALLRELKDLLTSKEAGNKK